MPPAVALLTLFPTLPRSPHFSRFLFSHPLSTPLRLLSLQPPVRPLRPHHPHSAIPRFRDLFSQSCRPARRSHTSTLILTPHMPRPKQTQALCPLFHSLGHFPCPFLLLRPGLLPRSTFPSPGCPGPPPLIIRAPGPAQIPFSTPPSHSPLLSSFPQWDCLCLLLLCSCLRALPSSLPLFRSRGFSSGFRLSGLEASPPCPVSLLVAPARSPPRSPERFACSLNTRRTAGLGCPPARHCAVEFGGISADVTSLPTRRPS